MKYVINCNIGILSQHKLALFTSLQSRPKGMYFNSIREVSGLVLVTLNTPHVLDPQARCCYSRLCVNMNHYRLCCLSRHLTVLL